MVFALFFMITVASCGYSMDTPRLPGDVRTVFIRPVRNLTDKGGLDAAVRAAIRQQLAQKTNLQLVSQSNADAILEIDLTGFSSNLVRSVVNTDVTSITLQISSTITLRDNRKADTVILKSLVNSSATAILQSAALVTPAVQETGLETLLKDYAQKVEDSLFTHF